MVFTSPPPKHCCCVARREKGAGVGLRGGPHVEQREAVRDGSGLRLCGDGAVLAAALPREPGPPGSVLCQVRLLRLCFLFLLRLNGRMRSRSLLGKCVPFFVAIFSSVDVSLFFLRLD